MKNKNINRTKPKMIIIIKNGKSESPALLRKRRTSHAQELEALLSRINKVKTTCQQQASFLQCLARYYYAVIRPQFLYARGMPPPQKGNRKPGRRKQEIQKTAPNSTNTLGLCSMVIWHEWAYRVGQHIVVYFLNKKTMGACSPKWQESPRSGGNTWRHSQVILKKRKLEHPEFPGKKQDMNWSASTAREKASCRPISSKTENFHQSKNN